MLCRVRERIQTSGLGGLCVCVADSNTVVNKNYVELKKCVLSTKLYLFFNSTLYTRAHTHTHMNCSKFKVSFFSSISSSPEKCKIERKAHMHIGAQCTNS